MVSSVSQLTMTVAELLNLYLSERKALSVIQKEADTKLVLHSLHALNESPRKKVIVRSPFGGTDVLVILLTKMICQQDKIYPDYGTGLNRKGLWLSNVVMSKSKLKALIGFHAFTGNDYISSYFRKGKPA